jgi:hypothetical protein
LTVSCMTAVTRFRVSMAMKRLALTCVSMNLFHVQSFNKRPETIPVTGREGEQGCETSRFPFCLDNRLTEGGGIISLTRRPRSPPQKHFLVLISVRG